MWWASTQPEDLLISLFLCYLHLLYSLEMFTKSIEIVLDSVDHKFMPNLINGLAFAFEGYCILKIHYVFGEENK
jgi:hypothetical protein